MEIGMNHHATHKHYSFGYNTTDLWRHLDTAPMLYQMEPECSSW